jgi:hypothetical protein
MARITPYSSWIWLAVALLAIGVVRAIAVGAPAPPPLLASSSSAPSGGLALQRYVRALGHAVAVDRTGSQSPCAGGSGAVIIGMDGADLPASQLSPCLRWVSTGGTIIVLSTGSTAVPLLQRIGVSIVPVGAEPVAVVQPLLLHPPVSGVDFNASTTSEIGGAPPGAVALAAPSGSVLERFSFGRGVLWVDTDPEMFTNQSLSGSNASRVFANLMPPRAAVTFEEYVGASTSLGAARGNWLSESVWGVAAIFLLAVFLLYRGLSGVRLGPPVTPLRETHRPATEYIVSMARTLRSAHARADLVRLYARRVGRTIRERHLDMQPGEVAQALVAETAAASDSAAPRNDAELVARVRQILELEQRVEEVRV